MKWSQIIAPLVAMAIAAVIFAVVQNPTRTRYRVYLAAQTRDVASKLIATTNSPRLLAFGPRLREQLASYLSSPTGIHRVSFGDLPAPAGNGQAAACVFLTNATNQRFVIRLSPSSVPEKFDLIGFSVLTD